MGKVNAIKYEALVWYARALEQPEATRTRWIKENCPEGLVEQVETLLAVQAKADEVFVTGGLSVAPESEDIQAGYHFGPYRIARRLGQGGMGVVYLAARADGAYTRDVAIKVVSHHLLNDELRARFVNERQILANLQHPNIAQLLDGGTEDHRTYLVMEYIDGDAFRFDGGRPIDETLQLFAKVCNAVQFAHNNLVLHRDIKPENVLVGAEGEPKLLDFGVAKLSQSLLGDSGLTQGDPAPLTVNYAAPERLAGEDATIVSDVYSLGVYLYTLVFGEQPYDIRGLGFVEAYKQLSERQLNIDNTDVSTVIAKAMHLDPMRRYVSAGALAEDLRRISQGKPITARADDFWYVLKRQLQRHKAAVAAAGIAVAALVGATLYSIQQAQVALKAQQVAETQASRATSLNEFMQSMFKAASPASGSQLGMDSSIRELLSAAESGIDAAFAGDPALVAETYLVLSSIYNVLFVTDKSPALLRKAREAMDALPESERVELELEFAVNTVLANANTRLDTAKANCEEFLPIHGASNRDAYQFAMLNAWCADVFVKTGDVAAAKRAAVTAEATIEKLEFSLPIKDRAYAYASLGGAQIVTSPEDAARYLDRAIQLYEELNDHSVLLQIYIVRSSIPNLVGDAEESLHFTGRALAMLDRLNYSSSGYTFGLVHIYHADRLVDLGRVDEAKVHLAKAREPLLASGAEHAGMLVYFTDYKIAFRQSDYLRGEQALLKFKEVMRASGVAYSNWIASADLGLGKIYHQLDRPEDAVPLLSKAHDYVQNLYGADHSSVLKYAQALKDAQAALEQDATPRGM